jgi:hypothetical protein
MPTSQPLTALCCVLWLHTGFFKALLEDSTCFVSSSSQIGQAQLGRKAGIHELPTNPSVELRDASFHFRQGSDGCWPQLFDFTNRFARTLLKVPSRWIADQTCPCLCPGRRGHPPSGGPSCLELGEMPSLPSLPVTKPRE